MEHLVAPKPVWYVPVVQPPQVVTDVIPDPVENEPAEQSEQTVVPVVV